LLKLLADKARFASRSQLGHGSRELR
jgi:hypothetical protein